MQNHGSTDPAALLMGALADEIADRLAIRLASQLVEIAEAGGSHGRARSSHVDGLARDAEEPMPPDDGLWTAGRIAAHYDVTVRFVYQHAEELGCVRLGGGARPRLRFDPEIVRERWSRLGYALSEPVSTRRQSTPRPTRRPRSGRARYELLDFDREP